MIPARIYRRRRPSRIVGYLSNVWGGCEYTRSLERDLEVLHRAVKALERELDHTRQAFADLEEFMDADLIDAELAAMCDPIEGEGL